MENAKIIWQVAGKVKVQGVGKKVRFPVKFGEWQENMVIGRKYGKCQNNMASGRIIKSSGCWKK